MTKTLPYFLFNIFFLGNVLTLNCMLLPIYNNKLILFYNINSKKSKRNTSFYIYIIFKKLLLQ